ncbi:unnamed protein product, partial [Brassica rapa]
LPGSGVETGPGGLSHGFQEPPVCGRVPQYHGHEISAGPRWFVLHTLQHWLKPVHSSLYPAPLAGSCFVTTDWGIYCIGGFMNGKPTSEVTFFNAIDHSPYRAAPIKMARSGSSASLINKKKMPLNIQQSVVIEGKVVYGVDGDGQIFHFTPSTTSLMFTTDGIVEPNPENRNDWFLFEKEVKGLEELQQQHIIKICSFSEKTIAIFWDARWPQQGLGALVCRDFHEETPGRRGVVEGLGEH